MSSQTATQEQLEKTSERQKREIIRKLYRVFANALAYIRSETLQMLNLDKDFTRDLGRHLKSVHREARHQMIDFADGKRQAFEEMYDFRNRCLTLWLVLYSPDSGIMHLFSTNHTDKDKGKSLRYKPFKTIPCPSQFFEPFKQMLEGLNGRLLVEVKEKDIEDGKRFEGNYHGFRAFTPAEITFAEYIHGQPIEILVPSRHEVCKAINNIK